MRFKHTSRLLSTVCKPLNVLFFGSDQFSAHSLRGLEELTRQGGQVGKIQLVTRSPKWCGRHKSVLKYPPIVKAASDLGLQKPLLCDSRQDLIDLTRFVKDGNFNLIVAVSFGKLIPAELVNSVPIALNVHPSLLPRYKGASPIQHALLRRDISTGVTVQTLHPSKFDQGSIVARTDPLEVEKILSKGTTSDFDEDVPRATAIMMDQLGIEGSKLLQRVITQELYLKTENKFGDAIRPSYAPKISTEMKHIDWIAHEAPDLLRKLEVLGPLYSHKEASLERRDATPMKKRIIFHQFQVAHKPLQMLQKPGAFTLDEQTNHLLVKCKGDSCIEVTKIQFEGFKVEDAKRFMKSLPKRCGKLMAQQRLFL